MKLNKLNLNIKSLKSRKKSRISVPDEQISQVGKLTVGYVLNCGREEEGMVIKERERFENLNNKCEKSKINGETVCSSHQVVERQLPKHSTRGSQGTLKCFIWCVFV